MSADVDRERLQFWQGYILSCESNRQQALAASSEKASEEVMIEMKVLKKKNV